MTATTTRTWVVRGLPVSQPADSGCERSGGDGSAATPTRPRLRRSRGSSVSLFIDVLAGITFALGAAANRTPEPPRPEPTAWLCDVDAEHCHQARDAELAEPEGTRAPSGPASWVARTAVAATTARFRALTAGPLRPPGHPDLEIEGS